ncbi:alpha/beta hydrolase [Candidatus Poriferisocius sp.]|uniref:alpha/beta hydrolase n=1 Tax=Candidatus Poriferisocius sp. TaxID=3101276 RepID=UPI003B01A0A8
MATVALHEEIEPLKDMVPLDVINAENLPELRGMQFGEPPELSDAVERTDHVVDEANGVVVRVHREVGSEGDLPCVYSIHGGGYILGSRDIDDAKFDQWCPKYSIVGASVEYRLAPETPYPGALEDCYTGLKWAYDNADELGIDRDKIGITGVSAGGGLCAALALLARDRGEVPLQFQLLDCPMLDDRQITPSSKLNDLIIWTRESNSFGWQSYLGDLYGSNDVPYTAAAARAEDLSGLPEAYVCVGGADGFRDEDIAYAMRLYGAGVPTELHVYPGAPHGVALFAHLEIAQRYTADQEDWLRRQIERLG